MDYTYIGLAVLVFFAGIAIGWFISAHLSEKKFERIQTERYENNSTIRKKIRGKFYNEIKFNIGIVKSELKVSAATRTIQTEQFNQACFRKNI